MAVSISDLVQRVRDQLGERPFVTSSTTTTTATTVAVPDGTDWAEGSVGEWQTGTVGYEQFYVKSINVNDLTVLRGYNGTTAEAHTSGDAVIILGKDNTSGRQIQRHLTESLNSLWPYVYKTGTVSLTPSSTTAWYNLNALTVGIVSVIQLYGSSSQYAGRFGHRGEKPFMLDLQLPAALVASGKGIRFHSGIYHATNTITVTDQRVLTGTSDIEDSAQFPVADCLVLSAVGRILQASEILRVRSGESMDTTSTVSTGSRLQSGAWFLNEAKQKLEELAIKYRDFYAPVRLRP